MTSNLVRRIYEHKEGFLKGFSQKYHLNKLVYCEEFNTPQEAIIKEKQLKKWNRDWKIQLIESMNPMWEDLYEF